MITYVAATPTAYAPNATLATTEIINKTVRAGEPFTYTHTASTRAMVTLIVVAPNTMVVRYSVRSDTDRGHQYTLIAYAWEESQTQVTLARGQTIEATLVSDAFVRLVVIGEAS